MGADDSTECEGPARLGLYIIDSAARKIREGTVSLKDLENLREDVAVLGGPEFTVFCDRLISVILRDFGSRS